MTEFVSMSEFSDHLTMIPDKQRQKTHKNVVLLALQEIHALCFNFSVT